MTKYNKDKIQKELKSDIESFIYSIYMQCFSTQHFNNKVYFHWCQDTIC